MINLLLWFLLIIQSNNQLFHFKSIVLEFWEKNKVAPNLFVSYFLSDYKYTFKSVPIHINMHENESYFLFALMLSCIETDFNNCICYTIVTTLHKIKISIPMFIQLTRCLRGSKIDHLSLCSCVTIGHLPHHHHFYFHYNFIIRTPWVRGSLKRLSRLSHGDLVSDPGVLNPSLIYSPCLSPPLGDIAEALPRTIW